VLTALLEKLLRHEDLTADEAAAVMREVMEGRAPGTRGGDLAAHYIAAQFEALGLRPAWPSGG